MPIIIYCPVHYIVCAIMGSSACPDVIWLLIEASVKFAASKFSLIIHVVHVVDCMYMYCTREMCIFTCKCWRVFPFVYTFVDSEYLTPEDLEKMVSKNDYLSGLNFLLPPSPFSLLSSFPSSSLLIRLISA